MKYEFPIYPLRDHYSIEHRDGDKIVHSFYGEKILDRKGDSEYLVERRLDIPKKELYALRYRCNSFSEIVMIYRRYKYKSFIDSKGEIFGYKPTTFVVAEWLKPQFVTARDGKTQLFHYKDQMLSIREPRQYVLVAKAGTSYIAIDATNIPPERTKVRRKI